MNNFGLQEALTLATLAAGVVGGLDFLIRWYFNSHTKALREIVKDRDRRIASLERDAARQRKEVEDLKEQIHPPDWISPEAQGQIDQFKTEAGAARDRADKLEKALGDARRSLEQAQAEIANTTLRCRQAEEQAALLDGKLTRANEAILEHEKGDVARNRIVQRTLKLEGRVWLQDVLHGAHRFIPLPDRKVPVVSVLNLKGGVGKTTLTAYLAWAMARRGYRVLLIDLDLQGSLSSLFLSEPQLRKRHDDGLLLRDYLAHAAKEKRARLEQYVAPVDRLPNKPRLLATTDKLGYEELNLTFQWLFRIGRAGKQWSGRRDVRMLLRRGLHRRTLKKQYDLVLLDCPPLINLCCINALAASDYVMVPVTPSRKAMERVPPLLGKVREIIDKVNSDLGVLGIVANRTQWKESMTPTEKDLWNQLPVHCQDVFAMPVYRFETFLPHRVTIRDAEADFPPAEDQDIPATIDKLAAEVEGRLPHFCRPGPVMKSSDLFGSSSEVIP
jgi:cellulose biosynthesis protein BcsQ/F0F1-type ATP synthase membrane subunit b/b'